MKKLTLDDLRALRDAKRKEMSRREPGDKAVTVLIGMGTCGIAAGAKETMDAFIDETRRMNLTDVSIRQTGCMGLCFSEPTVEVRMPGLPPVIYGNVGGEVARAIVQRHIMHRELIDDHVFDKPSSDIVAAGLRDHRKG